MPVLAEPARGRLRAKIPDRKRALHGHLQPQHRFLLRAILAHSALLDAARAQPQVESEQHLASSHDAVGLLQTIPASHETAAAAILAAIGVDLARLPAAKHRAAWAGRCPGNQQRGGKQRGGKRLREGITAGNPWLRGILGAVVWASAHPRDKYLVAQFHRLAQRRGVHKAAGAVAHSVLVSVSHLLREQRAYHDLGADYFDQLDTARLQHHHVRRLEQLGYTVTLTPRQIA